jgi:hypothetical protein
MAPQQEGDKGPKRYPSLLTGNVLHFAGAALARRD